MRHNGQYSDRFVFSAGSYWYHSYDFTHFNFVSICCHQYSFCFLTWKEMANRNRTDWPSWSLIWIPEPSHGASDSCTSRDKLSCLIIWSLKSRKCWHEANLIHKLHFPEIWHQRYKFICLLLQWHRSRHHVFVRIRFLYGDLLGRPYAGVNAYEFNRLRVLNEWWIGLHARRQTRYTHLPLRLPRT